MSLSVFKKEATTCAQVIVNERISKKLAAPSSKKYPKLFCASHNSNKNWRNCQTNQIFLFQMLTIIF